MRNPSWSWDELVLACELVARNGWKELREHDSRVHELSELLQKLPLHDLAVRDDRFRNTNSVSRKTTDLATHHSGYEGKPTKGGQLDLEVIAAFESRPAEMRLTAVLLRQGILDGTLASLPLVPGKDEFSAEEGTLLVRRHLVRERDSRLRQTKVDWFLKANGTLACEVCDFAFEERYGSHGKGYIEVHHVVPLHEAGPRTVTMSDLVLLCANCHRMSHRKLVGGGTWPNLDQLRELLTH